MRVSELLKFDPIIVQCHDNPDADAIASAYAMYTYFKGNGKNVRMVYSGNNAIQKSNLMLLTDYLEIKDKLEHIVKWEGEAFDGLVLTVDCQYGAGNVTKIPSKYQAIIDHHQVEISDVELSEIASDMGSCSTLIWKLLKDEGFAFDDAKLCTGLYFGLYTDTNSLSEIYNPYDKDMRDLLAYEKSVVHFLKNSNFSLDELEIAGNAMRGYRYYPENRFAIIKSEQCDPNILGLISDFLLQVAEVDEGIVYNEWPNGYKFSVRSCVKEVHANELAAFIAETVGSGGGHREKAGGFIRKDLYDKKYDIPTGEFFSQRTEEYFRSFEVIHAAKYDIDLTGMKKYIKKKVHQGYVLAKDVLPVGTPVMIRTLEGDIDTVVEEDLVIMIGIKGEVYSSRFEKFSRSYTATEQKYTDDVTIRKPDYIPTLYNRLDGTMIELAPYAKVCISSGATQIFARPTYKRMKIFTQWYDETYMEGKVGDYLAVRTDDYHDIYIIEKDIFSDTYEEMN